MDGFSAIVLICLATVSPPDCNESNAVEVRSTHVASEMECMSGWQEIVARTENAREVGRALYLKTLCRRAGREGSTGR